MELPPLICRGYDAKLAAHVFRAELGIGGEVVRSSHFLLLISNLCLIQTRRTVVAIR